MPPDTYELLSGGTALVAILILGTTHLNLNLWLYFLHCLLLGLLTIWLGHHIHSEHLVTIGLCFSFLKGAATPAFLAWIMRQIAVKSDPGAFLPAPLSMQLGVLLFAFSYLAASHFPGLLIQGASTMGAAAATSLIFTGILLMLTRRTALSQILGFLILENGIYLVALTETHGMPLLIEMGILLDVLVAVMIFGLFVFRIQKSFEHIDITQLSELGKDQ